MARFFALLVGAFLQAATVAFAVSVVESDTLYTFSNPLVSFDVVKTTGYIRNLTFNGTDYLGPVSGNAGQLYTDFPSAVFAITNNASSQIVSSPTGDWAGIVLTDNATDAGTLVQRSWFLRESETGLHSFLRLGYYNTSGPALGSLGESRTMFRPNSPLWTYLVTNGNQWAPAPGAAALADEIQVQDATWYLGQTPDDPYVVQEADYWTKYQFADNQTNKAHGLYSPASGDSNTSYGAWWVVNQKDTFFGGPLHIDLMVDGIIYNKQSTSHGGATSPNITAGFDRTFGPQFLYFNEGANATLHELLADAEQYANPEWNSAFYDEIAPYVVGYAPSSVRGNFSALIHLPSAGVSPDTQPMAVLAANGVHFQDDAFDPTAYQYWAPLDATGHVNISRVKEGTYRLTVYADGIFGDFTLDGVVVRAGQNTHVEDTWVPESAPGGTELWRLGVPDKSSGEFRNGNEVDLTHPLHPAKYRIYWGAWDFPTQFPNGVNFTIGQSDYAVDWNYIHWSQFGPTYIDPNIITGPCFKLLVYEDIISCSWLAAADYNNWLINFELDEAPSVRSIATYTIQLAAAKTTAGNTDDDTGADAMFPISTYVNSIDTPLSWTIQANESSSCGQRSAISCHLLSQKFEFPGTWLNQGWNTLNISLPFNASVYVQYDALRLELSENYSSS